MFVCLSMDFNFEMEEVDMNYSLNFCLFISKAEREKERVREIDIFHLLFTPQMPALARAGSGCSQEPETLSGFSTWLAGTQ